VAYRVGPARLEETHGGPVEKDIARLIAPEIGPGLGNHDLWVRRALNLGVFRCAGTMEHPDLKRACADKSLQVSGVF
jgi:hypothetical protein